MKKILFKFWWVLILLVCLVIGIVIFINNNDDTDTKKMLGTYSNGEARITLDKNGKCNVEVYEYDRKIDCKWEVMGSFDGKDIGQDGTKYPWAKIYMNDGNEIEMNALFLLNYTEFLDPDNLVKWEKQSDSISNSGKLKSAISKTDEPVYDTSYSSEPDIPIDNGKTLEDAKMEAQMFVDAYKQEVTNKGYDYYEMLHKMGYADESEFFRAMVEKYMNE